ncbi:hypothetical protein U1Q18_026807 [Sarracenia purpurea var. burkii]
MMVFSRRTWSSGSGEGTEGGASMPKKMVAFLVLLNQLICKFNTALHDILEELYPGIASRIFNILPRDAFLSGPGTNTEEIRELQELQRTLYTFLHVITTHDLSSVFLSPRSRGYLDPMMQLLLYAACNHKDLLVRKVPGFQTFVLETFAANCCLYSVLDKSFEFRDAHTKPDSVVQNWPVQDFDREELMQDGLCFLCS